MKKCLIVVDYQNDFVSGSLGFPEAPVLEPLIAEKIGEYRQNGGEILFTFDTHDANYMNTQEGENLPVPHCLLGTLGHSLYGRVSELLSDSDKCFCKNTFGSGELYEYLRTQPPFESIELVGLVSNICVISNAVLAKTAQPETPIVVDAACVGSGNSNLHNAALDVMAGLQVHIVNRD